MSTWYVIVLPRIPLIEDLTTSPIPSGNNFLVEFDSKSQWYTASLAIAAGWLQTGGDVIYNNAAQPPDIIRLLLKRFGLDVESLEKQDRFRIYDHYTQTLGQTSKEKYTGSLRVADASIVFSQQLFRRGANPNVIRIWDNASTLARFNEEKNWVEFELSRRFPLAQVQKSNLVLGIIKGVHSEWAYKQLEAAADGIVEFRFDESGDEIRNIIRISRMRNTRYDSRWHELSISENSVSVDK
jgi:KaiC/GvpD/RAD55 family RecA-like ATPase